MSLKAVHLLFCISFSLLAFGFGLLKLGAYRAETGTLADLSYGVGGVVAGGLIVVYGRYFLKKLKTVSYL
jgi:hypothetical protein